MPKFRSIHTKIRQSFDFNDMPDDFTRLLWVLLPLGLDCQGRGIYDGDWIKSNIFPLRKNVTTKQIMKAMQWFYSRKDDTTNLGMVEVYEVNGHLYFYVPKFKEYQRGFDKESPSVLPDPLQTNSRPIPDQVPTNSPLNAQSQSNSQSNSNAQASDAQKSQDNLFVAEFLETAGLSLSKADQGWEITEFRDKYGPEVVISAAAWLKEKRITKIEKALSSLRTALPTWTVPVKRQSALEQSLEAIRQYEMEEQDAVV